MREIRELLKKNIIKSWQKNSALGIERYIKFIANNDIYHITRTPALEGIQVYCLFGSTTILKYTDDKQAILNLIATLI